MQARYSDRRHRPDQQNKGLPVLVTRLPLRGAGLQAVSVPICSEHDADTIASWPAASGQQPWRAGQNGPMSGTMQVKDRQEGSFAEAQGCD